MSASIGCSPGHKHNPTDPINFCVGGFFKVATETETIDKGTSVPESSTPATPVNIRRIALSLLAVLSLIFLLRYARDLFIPAVLGILIAYALHPVVTWVTRLKIPRGLAAAVVVVGVLVGFGLGVYALRNQAIAAVGSISDATQQLRMRLQELRTTPGEAPTAVRKIQEAAKEIEKTAAEAAAVGSEAPARGITRVQIDQPAFRATDYLLSGSLGLIAIASNAIMVSFLVFFILASGDLFKRKLVHILGTTLSEKRVTVEAINEINTQIGRFMLIQVLTSAIVAVCTTAALWAFGVREPAIWGLAAGIFNSVPYFGAILVTAALAIVAFLQFGSLETAIQVAGTAFLITSLEGFLLTPALMGRAARINGVAMFVSLLFWSWLWGVIGMIVAVPMMMVIKIVCDRIESLQPFGELLGER